MIVPASRAYERRTYQRKRPPVAMSGVAFHEGVSAHDLTSTDLLELALGVKGSSKAVMVEVAGIEPASFGTSPGLLRVQPALVSQPRRSRRQAADGLSRCELSWSVPRPN